MVLSWNAFSSAVATEKHSDQFISVWKTQQNESSKEKAFFIHLDKKSKTMSSGRLFCLYLCQICFISSQKVSVSEMLFSFPLCFSTLIPREKSLTLRELAFPLFLRWKIFDHFQLLYTIGEMENSIAEEFSRHLWGITKLWPCLPASYYFRKPIMVRACLLFYFRQGKRLE